MSAFKKGDVVQLKSGGPEMTVQDVRQGGEILCVWFEKNQKRTDIFAEETLVKADGDIPFGTV